MFTSPTRERDPKAKLERMLDVAGHVFAENGFHEASLRDICLKAKVNLAAVKYYFGSKEALYREVMISGHRELLANDPPMVMAEGDDPEQALRRWVSYCLRFILLKKPSHPVLGRIMAYELQRPSACLDDLVKLVIQPFFNELRRIVTALTKEKTSGSECEFLVHSIIGVCVHYEHSCPIIERLGFPVPKQEEEIERFADHISRFILHGILGGWAMPNAK